MPDPDFHRYARDRDPEGFRRLVERHLPAVRAAAVRVLGERSALAEDVVQTVFTLLARKAAALPAELVPGAWLHRQTVRRSLNALRTEVRRERRERQFMETRTMDSDNHHHQLWQDLKPHLDKALLTLSEPDRQALVLRYLEERPLTEVSASLGVTANAAQKRVAKALEALRRRLLRHRVALPTAAVLSTLLSEHTAQAAMASSAHTAAAGTVAASVSAATVAANALTAAAVPAFGPLAFLTTMNFAKSFSAAALLLLLAGAGWQSAAHLPPAAKSVRLQDQSPADSSQGLRPPALPGSPWLRAIALAKAEDFPALAAEALTEKTILIRHDRLEAVFARWVEVAPQEGWDWVRKNCQEDLLGDRLPRDPRLAFLLSWTSVDGPAAYAACRDPANPYGISQWDGQLAGQWARRNPQSLLEFIDSGKWEKSPIEARASALRVMAATDPEEVYRKALSMTDNPRRTTVIAEVAKSLARRNPDQALAWAHEVPTGSDARTQAYDWVFAVMARQDPARTARLMDEILTGPYVNERHQVARPLMESWMRSDPTAALKWAATLGAGAAVSLAGLIDPGSPEALDFAKNLKSGEERKIWEEHMGAAWDASAAADFLRTKATPAALADESGLSAARTALTAWARGDARAAAAWLDQMPGGAAKESLRQALVARMADDGSSPAMILAQLKELHGMPEQDRIKAAVSRLAGEQPAEVVALIGGFPPGEKRDVWLARTAGVWAERDPQAAMAWADTIPSPETRSSVTQGILARWWPDDPPAAEAWLSAWPEGALKDSGLAQVAKTMAPEDPARALEWATSIHDAEARTASVAAVLGDWSRTFPDAARAALDALPLDADAKTQLAAKLPAPRTINLTQPGGNDGSGAKTHSSQP